MNSIINTFTLENIVFIYVHNLEFLSMKVRNKFINMIFSTPIISPTFLINIAEPLISVHLYIVTIYSVPEGVPIERFHCI